MSDEPTPAPDAGTPPPASAGAPAPAPATPPAPAGPPAIPTIEFGDFTKVEFKVGKVVEASDHTNADKLLVLKIDVGGEIRQIVSGIKKWYAPADLVGKHLIVVTNLKSKSMRGVDSQGMVLAASSGDEVILITTDKPAHPGSKVS